MAISGLGFLLHVGIIQRKVQQNRYIREIDRKTPLGSSVDVYFSISRDGIPASSIAAQQTTAILPVRSASNPKNPGAAKNNQ